MRLRAFCVRAAFPALQLANTYTLATALFPLAMPPVIATKNILLPKLISTAVYSSCEHCVVYGTHTITTETTVTDTHALIATRHNCVYSLLYTNYLIR